MTVTVPGNPAALRQASVAYNQAASDFETVAGQLRGTTGNLSTWQGVGAQAHAVRAQALAAAHQVGAEALNFGASALVVYATRLEAAQSLAQQANAAASQAADTAQQLNGAISRLPPGSTDPSLLGVISNLPATVDRLGTAVLQQSLADQNATATALGNQALSMAHAAAATAAQDFNQVAQLAGNPALHGASDPFIAYLGAGQPGQAAAMINASFNLGGVMSGGPGSSDEVTQALVDLAADPGAGAANQSLATTYGKADATYATLANKEFAVLKKDGITQAQLPAWVLALPPVEQAALLDKLIRAVPSGLWPDMLHGVSEVAGPLAAGLSFISLLQLGADPVTDVGAGAADAGAVAADAAASQAVRTATRTALFNAGAFVAGGTAAGADVGASFITGNFDVPQLVGDGLTVVPGGGAIVADLKVLKIANAIDDTKASMAALDLGSADYAQAKALLGSLEAGSATPDVLAKLSALYSSGFGTSTWVYSTASLGVGSG